jgi:hypothetical protein
MNFEDLVVEAIHNKYVKFDIEILSGPYPGEHYGWLEECQVYKARIFDNTNVQLIYQPSRDYVGAKNFDVWWFGREAGFDEQAKAAIIKYNMSKEAKGSFGDFLDAIS